MGLMFVSCTGRFKDLNTDNTGITDEDMQVDLNHLGIPLNVIQQGIYFNYDYGKGKNWPYQLMQNLSADMFSGYMHDYKPLNGGSHNSDYNLQDGWNGTLWENTYAYIMPQIKRLEDSTRLKYPAVYAVTEILKVEVMHRVSDYYGPVIYTSFGNKKMIYLPDSQQDVYYRFLDDLKTAVEILENYVNLAGYTPEFSRFDLLLDGKVESWIRFANSLRLRLAIRMAMADTDRARQEFVDAFADPRREAFFEPCPDDVLLQDRDGRDSVRSPLKGQYRGIRQGTMFAHTLYSALSKIYVNVQTKPILMTAAEVWFLRAEAALRGWTTEDPGICYEQGIRCSFSQWQVPGVETYLQSDCRAADFEDAFTPGNNIKARCLVTPRWDDAASAEMKLERIITQKWLAVFPEGCEAWAEQRRTGYPRLFPVRYNNSRNGCVDTEKMIRRLSYPSSIFDSDNGQYEMLVDALGGPDHAGTPLWWDTGRNF